MKNDSRLNYLHCSLLSSHPSYSHLIEILISHQPHILSPNPKTKKTKSVVETVSVTSGCGGVPGGGGGGGGIGAGSCYAGMAEPKPVCKECGRVYSSISNLKQHVANVHATSPIWEPCPICGKHFKTKQYLFNHLLQTHGIRQRGNRMQMMPFPASVVGAPQHHAAPSQLPSHPSSGGLGGVPGTSPHSLHMSVTLSSSQGSSSRAGSGAGIAFGHQMAPVCGPHSPMDSSNSEREVPHQAAASISHKDKDMSSAMEQCLQYLSSATK